SVSYAVDKCYCFLFFLQNKYFLINPPIILLDPKIWGEMKDQSENHFMWRQ
ncbi:hypothetical protein FHS11_005608, partial [Mucilaginibacter gotjawali]|nr:hypothetical protein [Mucilaginibacter gotjawali]